MKKQNGVTLVALAITIVVMLIIAGITLNIGTELIKEARLQDLVTNMLLIQVNAKECLEEAVFQKYATLEEAKNAGILLGNSVKETEVETKINDIKSKKGLNIDIANCYYLSESDLDNIGIKDISVENYGYFVIIYDKDNITAEILNTNGYRGENYTLQALQQLQEEN